MFGNRVRLSDFRVWHLVRTVQDQYHKTICVRYSPSPRKEDFFGNEQMLCALLPVFEGL